MRQACPVPGAGGEGAFRRVFRIGYAQRLFAAEKVEHVLKGLIEHGTS